MKIHVQIIGALTKPDGKGDFQHEVAEGSTIKDMLIGLGYQASHVSMIQAAVNGKQKKNSQILKNQDTVELSLPVGGG